VCFKPIRASPDGLSQHVMALKHRHARWLPIAIGVLSAAFVAACSSPAAANVATAVLPTPVPPAALSTQAPPKPPPAAADGPNVSIENFNFVAADLTVKAGTTVVWTNHDDVEHTITASDNSYSSPSVPTEGQFSHTFDAPGTYSYFCALHPFMTAKVIVQ
jgi:plastocyanin